MSKYHDPTVDFKLDLAKVSKVDDEQFRQMLLIFHICYNLTGAPDGSLEWLEALYLTGEFSKEGPIKMYDRWIAKKVAPSEDLIEPLIEKYKKQRQLQLRWQESDKGLLMIDAKLICDQSTLEWFYLYEFPFLRLVERVWDLCPIGLETPRIKSIAKREYLKMYPDRDPQPKQRRKQSQKDKIKRTISSLLSLLEDYNNQYGKQTGPYWFEAHVDEILEDKGNPLIIKVSES